MPVPELGGDDKKERNIDKILALMRTTGYQKSSLSLQVCKGCEFK